MSMEINSTYGRYATTANNSTSDKGNTAKEAKQTDNTKENPEALSKKYDEVSFSKEGYENYRKSVSENGQAISYENVARQKEILSNGIDYCYNLSQEADKLNKAAEEALTDGDTLSWQTKRDNLDKAYQNLRDEIVQGYENGTRQVNVIDENSETGYRILTMEEELSALDAAYEKNVKGFEELAAQQEKAEAIIGEWQEQIVAIEEGKNSDEAVEKQEETDKDQNKSSGMVGINAGKLARMLASAKTRSQVQAVIAKIQSDLQECEAGKNNGMDVDEESVKAAEQLLQEAKSRMSSAENREATPEEEMAAALASLM